MSHDSAHRPDGEHPTQAVIIDLQRASARRYPPMRSRGLSSGGRHDGHQHWSVREDVPEYRGRRPAAAVEEDWSGAAPLVLMAMPAGREFMQEAVRAGAAFYVLRDAGEMAELLAGRFVPPPRPAPAPKPSDPLTRRQRDVLRQVALGRATKEIAYELRLSPKTVAAHRAHIMERLGLRDVAAMVIYALRRGIVEIGEYGDPPALAAVAGGGPRR